MVELLLLSQLTRALEPYPRKIRKDRLAPPHIFSDPEQLKQVVSTFGEGEVGQRVQAWIDQGLKCETKTSEQKSCEESALASVDFESPMTILNHQGPESILSCLKHIKDTWMGIQSDLMAQGRTPNLTINGHGRP